LARSFVGLALLLVAEYRKAFFADPLSIMSTEVLSQILRLGGPGYTAIVVFLAGALLLAAGVVLLLMLAWLAYLMRAPTRHARQSGSDVRTNSALLTDAFHSALRAARGAAKCGR